MKQAGGFTLSDTDKRLIRNNAHFIREGLFTCMTQSQVECAVGFARFLSSFGLNAENYDLFLRFIMTNNPWVIDELIHDREPRLLFSTIRPDADLIEAAFQTLFSFHPDQLYHKALQALLGIVESAYFAADDGYKIRPLSIMDINALGKFLLKEEPQDHPVNRLILAILDRLTHLGEYYQEPDKNVLAKHAFAVRYAYFDHTRRLIDAIPQPLLARIPDRGDIPPDEDFAELVNRRRGRRAKKESEREASEKKAWEAEGPSVTPKSVTKPTATTPKPAKPAAKKQGTVAKSAAKPAPSAKKPGTPDKKEPPDKG